MKRCISFLPTVSVTFDGDSITDIDFDWLDSLNGVDDEVVACEADGSIHALTDAMDAFIKAHPERWKL